MSNKRPRSPSPHVTKQVFKSSSIEDRSSTFVAVYSPTFSAEALQALPEFKDASHRMAAWRMPSRQRSLSPQCVFETGYDDDGENHGGKTLEKLLVTRKAAGAVMVARWYGGVMLGPVRFDHIRNCADEAISKWRQEGERASKWAKTEVDRQRLIEILPERDQSIAVLRALLSEKKRGVSSQEGMKISSSEPPDYAAMDHTVLERLERVRDKTIGWILAQIEKAEKIGKETSNTKISGIAEDEWEQEGCLSADKAEIKDGEKIQVTCNPAKPAKEAIALKSGYCESDPHKHLIQLEEPNMATASSTEADG